MNTKQNINWYNFLGEIGINIVRQFPASRKMDNQISVMEYTTYLLIQRRNTRSLSTGTIDEDSQILDHMIECALTRSVTRLEYSF